MSGIKHQRRIPTSAYKMAIFAVVTALLIGLLATLIGNISFTSTRTFYATFTDVTGVYKGDRVRLSGVEVGTVKGVEMQDADDGRKLARVEFTVQDQVPIFRSAMLEVRFENIVGQRYLAIEESPGDGEKMPAGATFPVSQTWPALNLTQLFNGFQPLLRALDPKQINEFSYQVVRAFQGEAGSFASLLEDTSSLTNHLADRDQVIGELVGNLNTVLGTVGTRDAELSSLIVKFRDLMTGLASQRDVLSASLPRLGDLLEGTTGLLTAVRPPLRSTLVELENVAGGLAKDRKTFAAGIAKLPRKLRFMVRSGSYGSYFNFTVCGLEARLRLLGQDTYLGTPGLAANDANSACSKAEIP